MFELIFGGVFTFMALLFTIVMLGVGLFGGEPTLLLGLLFLLPFWAVGITCLKKGIRKIRIDKETQKFGRDTFALVVNFTDSGCYVNACPVWNAHFLVLTEYGVQQFKERVGTNPQFDIGDIVAVKYYNNDINVGARVPVAMVPEEIRRLLLDATPLRLRQQIENYKMQNQDFIVNGDYIIVDGVRYQRPM